MGDAGDQGGAHDGDGQAMGALEVAHDLLTEVLAEGVGVWEAPALEVSMGTDVGCCIVTTQKLLWQGKRW